MLTGTFCLDSRLDTCYTDFKFGVGVAPIEGVFHRNMCCCSTVGKAWGSGEQPGKAKCEQCPRLGTAAFTDLCPRV